MLSSGYSNVWNNNMCFSQPKMPKPPKPKPLPPAYAAPPPPPPPKPAPTQLQQPGDKPDLRIGSQKASSSRAGKVSQSSLKSGLNMGGSSGGLNL